MVKEDVILYIQPHLHMTATLSLDFVHGHRLRTTSLTGPEPMETLALQIPALPMIILPATVSSELEF